MRRFALINLYLAAIKLQLLNIIFTLLAEESLNNLQYTYDTLDGKAWIASIKNKKSKG